MARLLADIHNQAESLAECLAHHSGKGRAAQAAAAEAILDAKTVVLAGMGASYFATIPLAYQLMQHGIPAVAMDASELLHYGWRQCREATVILVSRSGETVEITKLLPLLRECEATVIGVTNVAGSTLAKGADLAILVNSGADEAVAVQTYTGTVAALQFTGALVTKSAPLGAADCGVLGRALMTEWARFEVSGTVYLLGRGPSMASVLEGALLFHEVAKWPAAGLSAGYFRHGPVEVVDGRFQAIVFALDRVTRELNLALASDLAGCGARVAVVGPVGVPGCVHWLVPEVSAGLGPIVEILPVQVSALRLAEREGIVPGVFRLASAVTLAEAGFGK